SFDEFSSPLKIRKSPESISPSTPFGEPIRLKGWSDTYMKLFDLLDENELPKNLRGTMMTIRYENDATRASPGEQSPKCLTERRRTSGEVNYVDDNWKRVVAELKHRNSVFSSKDDQFNRLPSLNESNLFDHFDNHAQPFHKQRDSSLKFDRHFDLPTIDLEEIYENPNEEQYVTYGNSTPCHTYRSSPNRLNNSQRPGIFENDLPEHEEDMQYYPALRAMKSD
ncbi:hypothetical protein PMAYCL1PPCAC_01101, partial [Pristionchus mayeri]